MVASLNTRGVPVRGSHLAQRYRAIAAIFESSDADVVAVQEVNSYFHLRTLVSAMPSFRSIRYRATAVGPAGGLVTLARVPVHGHVYHRFAAPSRQVVTALPRRTSLLAGLKGALVTQLAMPGVHVINTHPSANHDGDWSPTNRFHSLHHHQLKALGKVVQDLPAPVILCGDFNISRESDLFTNFLDRCDLKDAFDGNCPPTFHSEYLDSGSKAHCIDFLLTSPETSIIDRELLFTEPAQLRDGPSYLSDHIGLKATVRL